MYFHSCISIRGCALFSLWNSPHHGRHKMVENKGSNVRYNKINIAFPDCVRVENIIPRNMIINLGLRVAVKLNSLPYIRRYTSPNENFEYSYPLNVSLTQEPHTKTMHCFISIMAQAVQCNSSQHSSFLSLLLLDFARSLRRGLSQYSRSCSHPFAAINLGDIDIVLTAT